MTDTIPPEYRSEIMSRVRGKDTKPELRVRKLLHRLGFRYRLHAKDLPGRPDVVFRSRKKAIFVHGCFWHRHKGCANARMPKSRVAFWKSKLEGNAARDSIVRSQLGTLGWQVLVVWECETRDLDQLSNKLISFLDT